VIDTFEILSIFHSNILQEKTMTTILFLFLFLTTGNNKPMNHTEKATFGMGCFWCADAVFQRIDGIQSIEVGYAGGKTKNPTYKEVSSKETGHAEVAQITFDPAKVSYEKLLDVFWLTHDPTTMNRQGNDVGTQYRSVIFYHNEKQKQSAEKSKKNAQKDFEKPIVTEISPLPVFYIAEDYHQNYYNNNSDQPYCQYVIKPKLEKLKLKLKY